MTRQTESVAFVIPTMNTTGGGTRFVINLANAFVGRGYTVQLVTVGDVAALADGIRKQLRDPTDSALLRERANGFSVEAAADAYEDVFFG